MSVNLIRNSRVFFTTNVDSFGRVRAGLYKNGTNPFTVTNTFEIQVLEGMSFSQNTAQETVTLNEAGATPARGQRSFNTALEPADFSFSTYIRPFNTGTAVTCEESVLWNAWAGNIAIGQSNAAWVEGTSTSTLSVTNSNKHQLQAFGLIITFDGLAYALDNCALDSATIDFGLDQIANIQWAGKATLIRPVTISASVPVSGEVTFTGADVTGTTPDPVDKAKAKNTNARYIANKLTTLLVNNDINDLVGTDFTVPITGGSITLANNLTYLTPANLGTVNLPITYFTGTRSVTGTLNAYLRTGASNTGGLLSTLLTNAPNEIEPSFATVIQLGGGTSNTRVELKIPAAQYQIPSVNTEQVISTTINFTGQGFAATAFDINEANEIAIDYRAEV